MILHCSWKLLFTVRQERFWLPASVHIYVLHDAKILPEDLLHWVQVSWYQVLPGLISKSPIEIVWLWPTIKQWWTTRKAKAVTIDYLFLFLVNIDECWGGHGEIAKRNQETYFLAWSFIILKAFVVRANLGETPMFKRLCKSAGLDKVSCAQCFRKVPSFKDLVKTHWDATRGGWSKWREPCDSWNFRTDL